MRKISFILLAVVVFALLLSGTAFANFGIHGGYAANTDQCAACHRAHTSFSSATWTDFKGNSHSALLVSSASTISQFCNACHGAGAPGASTNVVAGVFEGSSSSEGPSTENNRVPGVGSGQLYITASTQGAKLNGGAFAGSTSVHNMDNGASATDPMWGYGSALPAGVNLTCTDCHDPHGSSNYRLLKDSINGVTVGGYNASETPDPFVVSNEVGYPEGGWLKHDAGASQMADYRPDYTNQQLAHKDTGLITGNAQQRSLSAWCASCHTQYAQKTSAYDYTAKVGNNLGGAAAVYHRHPVDISLAAGVGPTKALAVDVETTSTIPLEFAWNNRPAQGTTGAWSTSDYLGCLSCHFAHGTTATMTAGSWATAPSSGSVSNVPTSLPSPTAGTTVTGMPVLALAPGRNGTDPNNSSSLLRLDNRGVCEACHNK